MINAAIPLPIGNAVRLLFASARGTKETKILRLTSDSFTDQDTSGAITVFDGLGIVAVDATCLTNGTPYYYRQFDYDGTTWTASATVSATPTSAYQDVSADVVELVRGRLESGLRGVVAAGKLKHDNDYIPVYSAPPLTENAKWPLVSVHLDDDARADGGIGDGFAPDYYDPLNNVEVSVTGWLSRVRLSIVGWSLNPDERNTLRGAIKAVMLGNTEVFAAAGLSTMEFSQRNAEDFESYAAPVYMANGDFTCMAPTALTTTCGVITGVTVQNSGTP